MFKNWELRGFDCPEEFATQLFPESDLAATPVLARHTQEWPRGYVKSPEGYVTRTAFACDGTSRYWSRDSSRHPCPLTPSPPLFTCTNQYQSVPFTLVCDFRWDCNDHSDENFCIFPLCSYEQLDCGNKQCIPYYNVCDSVSPCINGLDEKACNTKIYSTTFQGKMNPLPPAIVDFDGNGQFSIIPIHASLNNKSNEKTRLCPETHFECPENGYYCLPVYVRCYGVYDCPGHEDEADCDNYACPGYYRCRTSRICLHVNHVCDGIFQCPQHDDELLCDQKPCPGGCTCYGQAFICQESFFANDFPQLRYVDVSGTGMSPTDLLNLTLLVYVCVAQCGLVNLDNLNFPNLLTLDMSHNKLVSVNLHRHLQNVPQLRVLSLAANPLVEFIVSEGNTTFSLNTLDLSPLIKNMSIGVLQSLPLLQTLNVSSIVVTNVEGGFEQLRNLKVVDLRGSPMSTFPRDVFKGLDIIRTVYTDNYKLCCPGIQPSDTVNCHAPLDEISSCENLLRSGVYRVVLLVFAILTLLGNLINFVYRMFVDRTASSQGNGVFVLHLCVSDFLMGVYLALIGVADRVYLGSYLWNDVTWRHSATCTVAGVMSFVSSEVSALVVCFITLDRFLVLRFPFSRFRFQRRSAHVVCVLAWCIGMCLAVVPLLPVTSHWQFYRQKADCIPLPITRSDFAGRYFFFGIIVLNFTLFLLIGVGQAFIYWSVHGDNLLAGITTSKTKDMTVARRFFTVAMSDFFCWFPTGLLALLAARGTPVTGEVNVAMTLLVLPLNSAINPFLYTLNILLDRRRRSRQQRMQQAIDKTNIVFTKEEAWKLLDLWIIRGVLSSQEVRRFTN